MVYVVQFLSRISQCVRVSRRLQQKLPAPDYKALLRWKKKDGDPALPTRLDALKTLYNQWSANNWRARSREWPTEEDLVVVEEELEENENADAEVVVEVVGADGFTCPCGYVLTGEDTWEEHKILCATCYAADDKEEPEELSSPSSSDSIEGHILQFDESNSHAQQAPVLPFDEDESDNNSNPCVPPVPKAQKRMRNRRSVDTVSSSNQSTPVSSPDRQRVRQV